jgi:hypothetical protein
LKIYFVLQIDFSLIFAVRKANSMKSIIEQSISKGYSYLEYRNYVSSLLKVGKSTGNDQSEDLLNYSELNEVRMNRLDKTMEVPAENVQKLQSLQKKYIWLVISEGWCGDAAQIVPIIHKMDEVTPNVELKIVLRDENESLMNLFLTGGSRSIPKLVVLNRGSHDVLAEWGARPIGAKQLIIDYKAEFGVVDLTAKTELQKWYLNDKGLSTQKEIIELMIGLE